MILCFLYCQGRLATNFEPIEIDEQDLLEQLVFIHMLAFVQKHGSNVDCGESFAVMLENLSLDLGLLMNRLAFRLFL